MLCQFIGKHSPHSHYFTDMYGVKFLKLCLLHNVMFVLSSIPAANARCIITSDVAVIGKNTYQLKSTVDRALTSLRLRSKSKLGSRCTSTRSLDHSRTLAPPTLKFERSISSGEYSPGDEEDQESPVHVKKSKSPFIVLMSTRSEDRGQSKVPWNEECDFKLEEVCACVHLWVDAAGLG